MPEKAQEMDFDLKEFFWPTKQKGFVLLGIIASVILLLVIFHYTSYDNGKYPQLLGKSLVISSFILYAMPSVLFSPPSSAMSLTVLGLLELLYLYGIICILAKGLKDRNYWYFSVIPILGIIAYFLA